MAILLGVFIIFGITPGKKMLGEYLPLTLSMAWTTCFTNIMGAVLLFFTSSYLLPLTRLPVALSMPIITIFILIGSFSTLYQVGDLAVTFAFALLGCYAWKKAGYSIAPFILAFILGKEAERNFRLAYVIHGPLFFLKTYISIGLCVCFILALGYPFLKKLWKSRGKAFSSEEGSDKPVGLWVGRIVPAVFLCIVLLFLYSVSKMEIASSKTLPLMMIIPMILLLVWELIVQLRLPIGEGKKNPNAWREFGVWIWLALTIACVWLFSWVVAVPLSMIAISRIFFKRSWRTTLVVAIPLWILIILCFGAWLKMPMGQGELLTVYYF
jgi:hypothetical protein